MSNILVSLRKITLALTFILLTLFMVIIAVNYDISRVFYISDYLIYGAFILLFIFLVKEIKSKKGLNSDILFNGSYVISMIYILIVILRSVLDPYIIIGSSSEGEMIFFNYNSIFILMIVSGLVIYNILMMIGEKKNDRY